MELAKEAGQRGKLYATHIRDESDLCVGLFCAFQEAIEIGRQSGARVEISHMKCAGPSVWGRADKLLEMMRQAHAEGIDVTGDQYPYEWGSTWLSASLFARWASVGGRAQTLANLERPDFRARLIAYMEDVLPRRGGPDGIVITSFPPDRGLEGKSIGQIASEREMSVPEATIELYRQYDPMTVVHMMQEADVETIAASPWISVGSDGSSLSATGILSEGKPHPRNYACFPRYLTRFVRGKRLVSLEEAVRKMTSLPASRLGLTRRGRLQPGYYADVVLFDPAAVADTATFTAPHQYPKGISHVIVNGTMVVKDGAFTGATPGKVLRRFED
jgi:N-acyl-D-amino-acid deacylase